jgi:hypothetical protein
VCCLQDIFIVSDEDNESDGSWSPGGDSTDYVPESSNGEESDIDLSSDSRPKRSGFTQQVPCAPDIGDSDSDIGVSSDLNLAISALNTASDLDSLASSSDEGDGPKKKKYGKYKTFCKFCSTKVFNFERHLERKHKNEKSVIELLSHSKKEKEGRDQRRKLLSLIRNEGHYNEYLKHVESKDNSAVYPMQKLPCIHCSKIVTKNYLSRHQKKCMIKPINVKGMRHQAISATAVQVAQQTNERIISLRLRKEVLNKMNHDDIGTVVRNDELILAFGNSYLQKHKRVQIASCCSNKLRECARLLIEVRRRCVNPRLQFKDILSPEYYDNIVLATQTICGFDSSSKTYKAPSLALHMGTTLSRVSNVLFNMYAKKKWFINKDHKNDLKRTKYFKQIVETQWCSDVSSLALKDINEKKWKKPKQLPVTQDILTLRNCIVKHGEDNYEALSKNKQDEVAYRNLTDAALAYTILFNRKRIGDVQYLDIESYERSYQVENQTEYMNQLSKSEQLLCKSYKRVVGGGKGSRAVVILFPPKLQKQIELLLECRTSIGVLKSNQYLFAYPNRTEYLRSGVVLKQFAVLSGVKRPDLMTGNNIRKQIATIMLVANLDKEHYSELAKFMGHTEKTHKEFYEINQDAYQTAKIGNLLKMIDQGKNQGEIQEVDIQVEAENEIGAESEHDIQTEKAIETTGENNENRNKNGGVEHDENDEANESDNSSCSSPRTKKKKKQPSQKRHRWTEVQKKTVRSYFRSHINQKRAPKKNECEELMKQHPTLLKSLDWVKIKTYVYNVYSQAK